MSKPVKDSFLDLERHRQLLEDNIEKLRKSLRHWQAWEIEYEGLKEEILSDGSAPSREQLVTLAQDYESELITKKEIDDILGLTSPRTGPQVVNILDRRIDYVEQNVKAMQKQIELAENKLMAATVISTPDVRNEDGLPMTDIIEELDDDGNVVSSQTTTPGSARPQLLEVLRKAGVKDLPEEPESQTEKSPAAVEEAVEDRTQPVQPTKTQKRKEPVAPAKQRVEARPQAAQASKSVKFAADTKSGPEPEMSKTAKRIQEIMDLAKQADTKPSEPPIIPTDESLEDAALRSQMLQYSMSEVGAVVAQLDLEEGSDWSDDEYNEDEISSTDDEDQYGRSRAPLTGDEMRQRMIALEERLGVRMMENVGKKASDYDIVQEGIGRVTIKGQDEISSNDENTKARVESVTNGDSQAASADKLSRKRSVRFANELDVAPTANAPAVKPQPEKEQKITMAPVSDIVERAPAPIPSAPAATKKPSRFKAARNTTPRDETPSQPPQPPNSFPHAPIFSPVTDPTRTVPTGPQGRTLAPTIIEHDVALNPSAAGPDELDPQLLHQEVAVEYHKMRNRMIQRQGGFLREEESEIVPFTEEEGGPKKMSRFKAARLARA